MTIKKLKKSGKKAAKTAKYVYLFGNKKADGDGKMKPLLGGKGANLAEMTRIGLPVPPGFTITTEVCTHYYQNKRTYPQALEAQVKTGVTFLENTLGKKFNSLDKPWLGQAENPRIQVRVLHGCPPGRTLAG